MTFNGMTVVAFESRMETELARLIERYEGLPLMAPALREIPLESNQVAYELGTRLMAGQIDMLVLLTGVGTEALFEILKPQYPWPLIVEALQGTVTIARGAKTVAALKAVGLVPTVTVPEPNTWIDLVSAMDEYSLEPGVRIAVQEYGIPNNALVKAMEQRGAAVFPVPIYQWAFPDDLGPMRTACERVIAGRVEVMLITNAMQIDHVMQVLEQDGNVIPFHDALQKLVVGSIGPAASERLRHFDWPVDFEPTHSKMGVLVKEVSEQAANILARKR